MFTVMRSAFFSRRKLIQQLKGYGLFIGGNDANGAFTNLTETYEYATDVRTYAANLQDPRGYIAGTNNTEKGVIAGGDSTRNFTDLYSFASSSFTRGATLSPSLISRLTAAAGNNTEGVFRGGFGSSESYRYNHLYSNDTTTLGTNLGTDRIHVTAIANAKFGYWAGGYREATSATLSEVDRYDFANVTIASSTSLSYVTRLGATAGNTSIGLFIGGHGASARINNISTLTYSNESVASGGNLQVAKLGMLTASTASLGVIAGGHDGVAIDTVEKYNLDTRVITPGTSLLVRRFYGAGLSSTPGHL